MTETMTLATVTAAKPSRNRRLRTVPLDSLAVSPLNVRKHGPRSIETLAASIRSQGLLQPLIVREGGTGHEVVAGSRRLRALQRIAAEDGSSEPVPVILLSRDDDGAAIEASLAENIERLPMDELDQYTAFAALLRQGRSEEEIAASFGVTVLTVRRRLALARLIPAVHRLYREGAIDGEALKLLTLASRERQKAYVEALADPATAPPPWRLKSWLLGGAEIDTHCALFDEAGYKGAIAGDLFGESRYFTDADEFWRLQNEEVAKLRDRLLAKGWAEVHVVPPSERFFPHDWVEARKAEGGHVVIEIRDTGEVEVTKGILPRGARGRMRAAAAAGGEAVTEEAPERPELNEPLARHLDLIRLAAVREALVASPGCALRLIVAQMIAGSSHIRAEPERAVEEAVEGSGFATAREAAKAALGLPPSAEVFSGYGSATEVLARLIPMSDAEVMAILALVAAETLALGSGLVDAAGVALAVDLKGRYRADDALLELLRDRAVISAVLAEVIGEKPARGLLSATGTRMKEVIGRALDGRDREQVTDWLPRWLAFPQRSYTKRRLTARPRPEA